MAAPMKATKVVLTQITKWQCLPNKVPVRNMAVGGWLKRLRGGAKEETELRDFVPAFELDDDTKDEAETHRQFRKRQCIEEVRSYSPPEDAARRVQALAEQVFGAQPNWADVQLTDRRKKFNFLTKLIDELDHEVPNFTLHEMNTVEDVVKYFTKEVKDTSKFEDLSKLDLPKNLHMNLEFMRFDRETDKIHGGVTAFPGRETIVSSVKYRRKYKGQSGGDVINYPEEILQQRS